MNAVAEPKPSRNLRRLGIIAAVWGAGTVTAALVLMSVWVFHGDETFNGSVFIQLDRSSLCIHPDDNSEARCGVGYVPTGARVENGTRVRVRVLTGMPIPETGSGTGRNEVYVLTPLGK